MFLPLHTCRSIVEAFPTLGVVIAVTDCNLES